MRKNETISDKILTAKCKELVRGYSEVFNEIVTEVVDELSATITSNTTEGISLEYIRREGMKQGIKELLRRIHTKAAKQYD